MVSAIAVRLQAQIDMIITLIIGTVYIMEDSDRFPVSRSAARWPGPDVGRRRYCVNGESWQGPDARDYRYTTLFYRYSNSNRYPQTGPPPSTPRLH
jgi:hypothetical protein